MAAVLTVPTAPGDPVRADAAISWWHARQQRVRRRALVAAVLPAVALVVLVGRGQASDDAAGPWAPVGRCQATAAGSVDAGLDCADGILRLAGRGVGVLRGPASG